MPDNENDLGGKVSLDITDFKTNISELNRQIKVIDSGFKAAAAGMGDWGSNAEGLKSRIETLNQITDLQKKKVEALTAEYKKVAAEKGEDSKAAQDLQIRINKETESLNKNQKELQDVTGALNNFGKEEDDTSNKTSKLHGFLEKLAGPLGSIGAAVGKAAVAGVAAIGTAAVGAAAGAFKLATDAGKTADDLITMSNKTGISTKQLQEMSYASRFVDVDLETMTGSMIKLTKNMDNARGGSKDTEAAFKTLGIQITDQNGQLRDAKTVWTEAIGALGKMPNETERNALAMQLFGKSAAELNPLIVAGADELNRLGIEANNVGAVLSDDAIAKAGQFDDMMQTLDASFKGLAATIGVAAIPAVTEVVSTVVGIVPQITEAIKTGDWASAGQAVSDGMNGLVSKVTEALPGLATMASTIIGGLASTIITAVPQVLPPLIEATVQLLDTIVQTLTDNGPILISAGINALTTLIDGIIQAIPNLVDATVNIITALVDGILKLLPELIPAAIQLIVTLAQGLIDALPNLIEKIPQIVQTIVTVIVENLPLLIDAAIQIITSLSTALIENLPLLVKSTIKIVSALASGVIDNIPTLLATVPKMFREMVEAFREIDWAELGENLISGIVEGVEDTAKNLAKSVVNAAKSALNSAKSFLGISSPSRLMRDQVGKMVGAGLAEGITDSAKLVNAAMNGLNKQLVADGNLNISTGINATGSQSAGQPVITVNSEPIDYKKLAAVIADAIMELPPPQADVFMDAVKTARVLFPRLTQEKQRLGMSEV